MRRAVRRAAAVSYAFTRMMTHSASGGSVTSRQTSATGSTFDRRPAKRDPRAPGPMTAIGKRRRRSLRAIEALQHLVLHPEALAFARKRAGSHFGGVARDRVLDRRARLGVALHEGGRETGEHPDQVVEYQHLSIAVGARADADRRDRDALGDELRERRRHQLQHYAPAASAV